MASDFDNLESAALGTVLTQMGEALIHTDAAGTETAFTGDLAEEAPRILDEADGQAKIRTARGLVAVAELAAVSRGDTIRQAATGADGWAVDTARLTAGGAFWELRLTRPEMLAKSRQRFRIER